MASYTNLEGEEFTAVQYTAGETLPEGVTTQPVDDNPDTTDVVEQEEAFISMGDESFNMADGTWILTNEDGDVSLCHPTVFEQDYEEAS